MTYPGSAGQGLTNDIISFEQLDLTGYGNNYFVHSHITPSEEAKTIQIIFCI